MKHCLLTGHKPFDFHSIPNPTALAGALQSQEMNPIRETSIVVRNAALVTAAVVRGFCVGSALGLPVWIQGLLLIPAMLLFHGVAGVSRSVDKSTPIRKPLRC